MSRESRHERNERRKRRYEGPPPEGRGHRAWVLVLMMFVGLSLAVLIALGPAIRG